jgi:hypothetical protein
MMPDYPLFLALVENWHPLVLVRLAGFESLIDENQQCVSDSQTAGAFFPPDLVITRAIQLSSVDR